MQELSNLLQEWQQSLSRKYAAVRLIIQQESITILKIFCSMLFALNKQMPKKQIKQSVMGYLIALA